MLSDEVSRTFHASSMRGGVVGFEMESGIGPYLQYIGITEPELLILYQMRPAVDANSGRFLKTFYDHLLAFEGTRVFLKDEATIQRLLKAQRDYLLRMLDAKFDDEYYKHRCLIGTTHFKLGLDFRWYIGAYVLYLDFLKPLAHELFSKDEAQERLAQSAIRKAVLLDMSIVLEAYHEEDRNALRISQAQLLHSEKLSTIGLLSAGLAHEIGNPLASIQMICDNQLRKPIAPEIKDKFTRIRGQVQHIAGIVRQLVSFSRPPSHDFELTELQQVIEPALTMAKLSRASKDAEIKVEIPDDIPAIPVIRDQLAQVFLNLFLNAFDAIQQHQGVLRVSAKSTAESVIVEVEDNGPGIDASMQALLFKPFATTKEHGKGTGLGLFVSQGIVQRHGGKITVRSVAGKGTTFEIHLPRSKQRSED
jgi:signal transduction histidine kinase